MTTQYDVPSLASSPLEHVATYFAGLIRSTLREPSESYSRAVFMDNMWRHIDDNPVHEREAVLVAATAFLTQGECLLLAQAMLLRSRKVFANTTPDYHYA